MVDHHKDPNVYVIQSLNKKGPKKTVNRQQLFDLKKSQGDPLTPDPSIKGPKFDPKVKKRKEPQICHPYGTRSKTKATSASVQYVAPDTHFEQRGHSGLGQWVRQFLALLKFIFIILLLLLISIDVESYQLFLLHLGTDIKTYFRCYFIIILFHCY